MIDYINTMSDSFFAKALVHWINGNDAESCRLLSQIQTEHARNLLSLIGKPHITVLAQLPWITKGTQDILSGAEFDPKFIVRNIGFKPQDIQNRPYANVHDFYDPANPPDFYISQMVEWHLIPPNLQELPCPTFGQTSDYDLHIQFLHPWLSLFDELIVNGPDEREEVSKLSGVAVTAYPKTFSIPDTLPPLPQTGQRNVDFFMSGTTFHPYHLDKARLVNRILDIPDFNPLFYNGFLPAKAYYELLSHSKMALTFVRHADAMPTRGLESLAMGCALIVQKQSVLTCYLGEEEGVVTYDYEKDDLQDVMTRVKREWPLFEQRARRGAEIVRRDFSSAKVASQYLRFLTVLAAKPRPARQIKKIDRLDQKRPIIIKGWGFPHTAYKEMQDINAGRWVSRLQASPDSGTVNDLAREYLLDYSTWASPPISRNYPANLDYYDHRILAGCLELYRAGIQRFPGSLVLRFNMIRAALHFGNREQVSEALELLQDTLAAPVKRWEIAALDDVLPWDFFSHMFNYRHYFDTVTSTLQGNQVPETALPDLIRASLYFYLSHYTNEIDQLAEAVKLDPAFPFYRLRLAHALLERNHHSDQGYAADLLEKLASDSMLSWEACLVVERNKDLSPAFGERYRKLSRRIAQMRTCFHTQSFQSENWHDPALKSRTGRNQLLRNEGGLLAGDPAGTCPGNKKKVLYFYYEFPQWRSGARQISYSTGLGLEEGFIDNDVELMTVPMMHGMHPELNPSWLHHARELCAGQAFDQVWIELVRSDPGDEFLEWLTTVAPVRIALISETLVYDREGSELYPELVKRGRQVEHRLRFMTHAVTVEERDAEYLNERGITRALWAPPAVPAWSLADSVPEMKNVSGYFQGHVYGQRKKWLKHGALAEHIVANPFPEAGTPIPHAFDSANAAMLLALNRKQQPDASLLASYLHCMRDIRRGAFSNWIRLLQGKINITFPGPIRSFSGRNIEAMAAGSIVINWDIPDRPRLRQLFDEQEMLMYPRDNPDLLAERIRHAVSHPHEMREMAERALKKVATFHTLELRIRQILDWIETGVEPDYSKQAPPCRQYGKPPVKSDASLMSFMTLAGYPAYVPQIARYGEEHELKGNISDILVRFQEAAERRNVLEAKAVLENAVDDFPELATQLAYFNLMMGDDGKAEESYLIALTRNPLETEIHVQLALLAMKRKDLECAGNYLDMAFRLGPPPGHILDLLDLHRKTRRG